MRGSWRICGFVLILLLIPGATIYAQGDDEYTPIDLYGHVVYADDGVLGMSGYHGFLAVYCYLCGGILPPAVSALW